MYAVRSLPASHTVARAAARREFLSHRLNRFLHAHVLLVLVAGFLPLLTPGDSLARGASWWLLHAVLYAVSLSTLLLGLSSAQAEAEEFTWLVGLPSGIGPWLTGKAVALVTIVVAAAGLLALPTVFLSGGSSELLVAAFGAAGVSAVCSLAGLAIGLWIRDQVRGLIVAVAVWFVFLFGTDLLLIAVAGGSATQEHPDLWVAALMANPLDAFRITVVFSVERAAFSGLDAGSLTQWWIAHSTLWLTIIFALWASVSSVLAWLGARRQVDG
ncbi:MAG: hypothetical protein QM715_18190 [Nibricoccus sp.]